MALSSKTILTTFLSSPSRLRLCASFAPLRALHSFFATCIPAVSLFTVVAVLATACLPDPLDVHNIPQVQPKIVVSSQMIPGQGVVVLLTKSIGALEANDNSDPQALLDQIIVADAAVSIQGDGNTYQLQYTGNGVYGSIAIPLSVGQSYTLKVNSPTVGSVEATTVVKPLIQFRSVEANLYYIGRDTLAEVSYSIADPSGKNWYMLNAQHFTARDIQERILNPWITTKLLDDASFEGGVKQDAFKVLFDEVEPGDTLTVFLSNINKDYYDFMKIREDTRFGLVDFLGEPINYPTNVEGGLGFFNLYIPDARVFILE
jgi:hypothetical protein